MPDPDKYKGKRKSRKTRAEQWRTLNAHKLQPPALEGAQHVAEWLHEIGMYDEGDNGPKTLSWQTLAAWQQATGTAITADEMVMLRRLSREYVAQYYVSDDPNCPSPTLDVDKIDRDALSDRLDDAFDRMFDD